MHMETISWPLGYRDRVELQKENEEKIDDRLNLPDC